ncbi:MAG: glutamine amidotransferase [Mollicutes bacterium]|nr:glutamine amidotransferase [Mollicutes bacterium]
MKFTIAYLYYDLLNLYGENGNIKILKKQLEHQGINVSIKFLTIDDELDFDQYDLVYIGAGTEHNQKIALKHLLKYKEQIKEAIENDKFFLVTGNAIELFGKYIYDKNKKKHKALDIFKFTVKEEEFRMIDEAIFKTDLIDQEVIGFQNQNSVIKDNLKYPLFTVIKGIGSYPNSTKEGIHYRNFYGTYLIGPIIGRNPELLKYFVRTLIKSKNPNFKFKSFDLKLEYEAYQHFINKFYRDIITIN